MNHTFRKTGSLIAALCCCAALCIGCSGKTEPQDPTNKTVAGTEPEETGVEVYSPKVPKNKIDENAPGDNITGELEKVVNYNNKLTVKLDKVIELDYAKKDDRRILIAEMTITNNTQSPIDCSELTHFSLKVDGKEEISRVRDVKAAIDARKYYTRTNSTMESFNQEITGGETLSGYVYISAPVTWTEMELVYIPYKYYSNDTVTFKIDETVLTHYDENLDQKPGQPPSKQATTAASEKASGAETTETSAASAEQTTASGESSASADDTTTTAAETTAAAEETTTTAESTEAEAEPADDGDEE